MARRVVHGLLTLALQELRRSGEAGGNRQIARIASLFERLPANLELIAWGGEQCDETLRKLRADASQAGLGTWLDHVIQQQQAAHPAVRNSCELLLYRLLHLALIDIRAEASATKDNRAFGLAHLFHETPLTLVRVAGGEASEEAIVTGLEDLAGELGLEAWLQQARLEADEVLSRGEER